MKKRIFSLLLSLLLCFSLASTAMAVNGGFDPSVTINREIEGKIIVTVKADDSILSTKQPTLSVPCSYAAVRVTGPNGREVSSSPNGTNVTFTVACQGIYTITDTPLCVDGKGLANGEYLDEEGNISISKPDGGYAYYYNHNLILKDYDLTTNELQAIRTTSHVYITLQGSNTISCGADTACGIWAEGPVTFGGTGVVLGSDTTSSNNFTMTGGKLSVVASADGINVTNGNLLFKDGEVTIDAGSDGLIVTNGNLAIENGIVTIESVNDGLEANNGGISISGGNVSITSGDNGFESDQQVMIEGGTIAITSDEHGITTDGNFLVEGGTIEIVADDYGIKAQGDMTIEGGVIRVTAGDDGLNACGKISISDGDINITANDDGIDADGLWDYPDGDSIGSYISGGNLTITGGEITIEARDGGVESAADTTITGGHIIISANLSDTGDLGVLAYGKLTLGKNVKILVPENGSIASTAYGQAGETVETIKDSNGNVATDVELAFVEPVSPIIPFVPSYSPVVNESGNGGVTVSPKYPVMGDTVVITPAPDDGYEVDEVIITDRTGTPVEVIDNGDGTYCFVQPYGKVTITVTFKEVITACLGDSTCPMYPYTDLDSAAWYHDGIHYCIENGLMNGVGIDQFDPSGTTSRAMVVTILWRMAGSPVTDYQMDFEDVESGKWYTEAVRWAASEKIVEGYGDGTFGITDGITREQLATMLYRFAGEPETDHDITHFDDHHETSDWALAAKQWAVENGVIGGVGQTDGSVTLEPKGNAIRSHVAQMFMNFMTKIDD